MSSKFKLPVVIGIIILFIGLGVGGFFFYFLANVRHGTDPEVKYFKKALDENDPDAIYLAFRAGDSNVSDSLFEKAAKEGQPDAMNMLARSDVEYVEKCIEAKHSVSSLPIINKLIKGEKKDLGRARFLLEKNKKLREAEGFNFSESDFKEYNDEFSKLTPAEKKAVEKRYASLTKEYFLKHPKTELTEASRKECFIPSNKLSQGDIVEFGAYAQSSDGKISPLKWRVLDVRGKKALLITEDIIGYNNCNAVGLLWNDSSIREWLNDYFFKMAFNERERSMISVTKIRHKPNPHGCSVFEMYYIMGKFDTEDRVFLLSYDEASKLFKDDGDRTAGPTDYAVSQGCPRYSSGNYVWALRTRGMDTPLVSGVFSTGSFDFYIWAYQHTGIRPAVWIELPEK